jgi:hypothetical protein
MLLQKPVLFKSGKFCYMDEMAYLCGKIIQNYVRKYKRKIPPKSLGLTGPTIERWILKGELCRKIRNEFIWFSTGCNDSLLCNKLSIFSW